jgi:hypothetical protein
MSKLNPLASVFEPYVSNVPLNTEGCDEQAETATYEDEELEDYESYEQADTANDWYFEQADTANDWYFEDEDGILQKIYIDQGNFDEETEECDYESCDEGDEGPAIGQWFRVDGGYLYLLNGVSDGILYPKPIRRSWAWANRAL